MFDYDTNQYVVTNVCTGAAIYGHDGSLWGKAGGEDINVTDYEMDREQDDGSMKKVNVSEIAAVAGAVAGNRNPTDAGMRIGGQKMMLTYNDPDSPIAQLTRAGGGCVVGKTTTAFCIAFWKKTEQQSDGKTQTMSGAFDLVKIMTDYLTEQGY